MNRVGAQVGWFVEPTPPTDKDHFSLDVAAHIEADPHGHRLSGGESFVFTVCTPSWLAAESSGRQFGRYLLVDAWDWEAIQGAIRELCASVQGPDWTTVALKLARFANWEFEGYFDPANPDAG